MHFYFLVEEPVVGFAGGGGGGVEQLASYAINRMQRRTCQPISVGWLIIGQSDVSQTIDRQPCRQVKAIFTIYSGSLPLAERVVANRRPPTITTTYIPATQY